jgi:hypothetical protein
LLFVVVVTVVISIAGKSVVRELEVLPNGPLKKDISKVPWQNACTEPVKTSTTKKNLTHHTSIRSPKSLLRKPQSFALSKNEPTLERTSCRVCRRSLEWFRPLGVLLVPGKE